MTLRLIFISLTVLLSGVSNAYALSLKKNHPQRYVVQEGDTLWGISKKFLDKPWEWRKLWHASPDIKNPNVIYPGTVILFSNHNGKPSLRMVQSGTIRLSPKKRPSHVGAAIPPVPLNMIRPFLTASLVLDKEELDKAPYVVAYADRHLMGGDNSHIYVAGLNLNPERIYSKHRSRQFTKNYSIYRDNGVYLDPETNEVLGYAALHVADSRLVKVGDPATLSLYNLQEGVKIGDRLLPKEPEQFVADFIPQAPIPAIQGEIISMFNSLSQAGRNYVVVINRGHRDGLRAGDVLMIEDPGETIPDPMYPGKDIHLPNEKTGELMVFRTFDRVSFGLVMRAVRTIHIHDLVSNPV